MKPVRFATGMLAVAGACLLVRHAVAQDAPARAQTAPAITAERPLIEGLQVKTRSEPARAISSTSKLFKVGALAGAMAPTCTSVSPAAQISLGYASAPAASQTYWDEGCGSLVVDFIVPPGALPHFDFGGWGPGLPMPQVQVGGMSSPGDQASCNEYEENVRYWWKPTAGNAQWEFVYSATIEGRFVGGLCRLFAKDMDSRLSHQRWNSTSIQYRLRAAVEARVGNAMKPVRIQGLINTHFHPTLPL